MSSLFEMSNKECYWFLLVLNIINMDTHPPFIHQQSHVSRVISLLTFPRASVRVFVGIVLHPHCGVCWASSLLVGGAAGSRASLVVEGWIAAFRKRVLDAHSPHVPEMNHSRR